MTDPSGPEPPRRCPQHRDTPATHPCGACGDWRELNDEWHHRRRITDAERARTERDEQLRIRAIAVSRCNDCDDHGRAPNGMPCTHTPPMSALARQALAHARAALHTRQEANP